MQVHMQASIRLVVLGVLATLAFALLMVQVQAQSSTFTDEEVLALTPETTPRGINVYDADPNAYAALPPGLQKRFADLIQIAKDSCGGMLVRDSVPCLEGHVYQEQALYYHKLAFDPLYRVFCEIGFNAGHSTVAFLEANPDAQVVSFDLLAKPYSSGALAYIGREFPKRHFYLGGNSTETVPRVARSYPWLKCDVLSVDGGHDGEVPRIDIENMMQLAHCDSVLLMDDATSAVIRRHWASLLQEGTIRELECHSHRVAQPYASIGAIPRGFCLARYPRAPCLSQAQRESIHSALRALHG